MLQCQGSKQLPGDMGSGQKHLQDVSTPVSNAAGPWFLVTAASVSKLLMEAAMPERPSYASSGQASPGMEARIK